MNLRSSTNKNNKYRCSLFKGAKNDNDDGDADDTENDATAEANAMLSCQHAIGQHVKTVAYFFPCE